MCNNNPLEVGGVFSHITYVTYKSTIFFILDHLTDLRNFRFELINNVVEMKNIEVVAAIIISEYKILCVRR